MRSTIRVISIAMGLILAILLGANPATASRSLESSEARTTVLWEPIQFNSPEFEAPVECPFSLTLTLTNRSFSKTVGSTIGTASAQFLARPECRNGTAVALDSGRQRWPVVYQGFTGSLPRIVSVRLDLQRVAILIVSFGGLSRALYEGTVRGIANVSATGQLTNITADATTRLPLKTCLAGSLFCPSNITISGTSGTPTPSVTLTLH